MATSFTDIVPADYLSVAPLFATLMDLHGSIPAVLAGTAEGTIRVDDPTTPRVALLDGPEGLYLGGAPHPALDLAALRAAIHPFAYLYPADAWLPVIDSALPHPFMLRHHRVTLSLDLTRTPGPPPEAGRFTTRPQSDGVGAEVLDGDTVVAHCHEDMVVGDRVEVGIWTDPRYRRQGLARLAVAGAIAEARARGLSRMSWHCLTSNAGSLNTALRSGFTVAAEYDAFGACLPAENPGDFAPAEWLALVANFETGATQFPLLRVYAAEALANGGRPDDALTALEQLVESDWNGKAVWLEGSQAFEPLRANARFTRLIARQRQNESA